jgi:hypothetical protein
VPSFIRFVLWVGPRKRGFLIAHGCAFAVVMLLVLVSLFGLVNQSAWFWLFAAAISFGGGVLMGWFMWQLFIWPTLAFYPRNTEAPHQKYVDLD